MRLEQKQLSLEGKMDECWVWRMVELVRLASLVEPWRRKRWVGGWVGAWVRGWWW